MFDRSRLTRLITVALASCAVTWALAAGAFARPAGDTATAGSAPAFKDVPGDTNKVPSATTQAPAFRASPATPPRRRTPRRSSACSTASTTRPRQPAVDTTDDTGTIALILAIAAMLAALGAVTLTITRHAPSGRGRLRPPGRPSELPVTRRAGVARRPPVRGLTASPERAAFGLHWIESRRGRLVPSYQRCPDLGKGEAHAGCRCRDGVPQSGGRRRRIRPPRRRQPARPTTRSSTPASGTSSSATRRAAATPPRATRRRPARSASRSARAAPARRTSSRRSATR